MTPAELPGPSFERTGEPSPPRATDLNAKADLLEAVDGAPGGTGRSDRPLSPSEVAGSERPATTDQVLAADRGSARADDGPADRAVEAKAALLDVPAQSTPATDGGQAESGSRDRWLIPAPPRTLPAGDPRLRETRMISTPERAVFREGLVDRVIGNADEPHARPTLDLMGGGGASGKGFVLSKLVKDGAIERDNAVRLNPDEIKAMIPEFVEIIEAGDSRAADVVHEESSQVAKAVLSEAMDRRLNIVYDSTLGNPDKAERMLQDAKERVTRCVSGV
jgi:Zeta toxin